MDDLAAVDQVRGHRTEREVEGVEVDDVGGSNQQPSQQQVELLALHDPRRQTDAPANAESRRGQEVDVVLLAPEGELGPRCLILERLRPVGGGDDRRDLVG